MTRPLVFLAAALAVSAVAVGEAQLRRPKAELTPVVEPPAVRPGSTVQVTLQVELPEDIHVQSNEPRDPLLIPTVLTVTPPAGITVEEITYPPSTDFVQANQKEPLAVFEREFEIEVRLVLAADLEPGEIVVPARLRYQACDETFCYPPARAETEWRLRVESE